MSPQLPIDTVLNGDPQSPPTGISLGSSHDGRELIGYRFGNGDISISLIAGCHADEPVGPAMLDLVALYLSSLGDAHPLLHRCTWSLVPHANPDGEARNAAWANPVLQHQAEVVDLAAYLHHSVRELPGDDVEFGFPRHEDDHEARPENRAIAAFLKSAAPFALHGSFHGMAFAAGPWFLMERAWVDRTDAMRVSLRQRVADLGYGLHDVDRGGDKGFDRIDEGFTTRPDSVAMANHFHAIGDPATAALFRPSSMEWVRSQGGDPLTIVSEMPLFLAPADFYRGPDPVRPPQLAELRRFAATATSQQLQERAVYIGVKPMPIVDQMRLQLEFLNAALAAAVP